MMYATASAPPLVVGAIDSVSTQTTAPGASIEGALILRHQFSVGVGGTIRLKSRQSRLRTCPDGKVTAQTLGRERRGPKSHRAVFWHTMVCYRLGRRGSADAPGFRTIQVWPKDLLAGLRQAERR
jgi:hypothetical protein